MKYNKRRPHLSLRPNELETGKDYVLNNLELAVQLLDMMNNLLTSQAKLEQIENLTDYQDKELDFVEGVLFYGGFEDDSELLKDLKAFQDDEAKEYKLNDQDDVDHEAHSNNNNWRDWEE